MEAKKLRLGNWVLYDGKFAVITSVSEIGYGDNLVSVDICKPMCVKESRIDPIELTPDWHKKFGIKFNGHLQFEYMIDEQIECYYKKVVFSGDYVYLRQSTDKHASNDQLVTLWNNDIKKRPMWVHEWQDMYNLLAGRELQLIKTK